MKIIVGILNCFLFLNIAFTQDVHKIDSISMVICAGVKTNSDLSDSVLLTLIQDEYISPYLSTQSSIDQDSVFNHILLRTEKLCPEYSALTYRTNDNNGDWILLSEKPKSILNESLCSQFFMNNSYYYLEPTGDKVMLEIKDGYWVDTFIDNTYSKLELIENSNCEFEIQFIKSNNAMRMNFSKIGDRYSYQILSFEDDKYYMSVEIPGQNQYYKFILYINE